ncbi:MAG: molybdopterin-dependent oxidoreductase [Planctomycetota bacterium]|jgi:nitrate reductase NapA
MEGTDRREFLRRVGVAASAVVAFGCQGEEELETLAKEPIDKGVVPSDLTWGKAPCRFCGTGCGLEIGVKDGRAVAVRGDEKSPVNKGLLCVKGYHTPGLLYGEDRLRYPMLRQPDGSLKRISWDDALDLVAKKFGEAVKAKGPDAVAMYGSGQWGVHDGYAASKWLKGGVGTNNLEPNARLCMASAVMGFVTQFQSDEPMGCYDDFDLCDDVVFWGHNAAEMHPVIYSRILEHKRQNPQVRIIDLATRRTPTTDHADMYVEFAPGSDLALANGILHLILKSGNIDKAFIEENVVFKRGIEDEGKIGYGCYGDQATRYTFKDKLRDSSLEELRKFLEDYTPEKVSKISGVPVAQIRTLAEVYGNRARKTVSSWCMGVNQHYRGTWMNNLITNLHLITGKISKPGSGPFSMTGQPSACGTAREVGTLTNRLPADMVVFKEAHRKKAAEIWGIDASKIPAKPTYHAVDMFRAWTRADITAMWVQVTNPWQSIPNLNRIQRKPGDGKFLVVSEIYPTVSTDVADLILPSAAWIEREGVFGNSERRTQQWNKLVEPPGEAKEDAWQIMEVAKRMGLGDLFPYSEDNWHEEMYEEYRKFTVGHGKDLASYKDLKATRGLRWPVVEGKETRWRYAAQHDPYANKAEGVHFYKAKGYGEKAAFILRPYHRPPEEPDGDYPFWLCTGRVLEHWHTGSMTRRIKQLHQAMPNAYVEMNRADAMELGLKSGDNVKVKSRRGEVTLPVRVDARGRPPRGSVFVPFFDEGRLINKVTLDSMCNISKEPDYKKCSCRIEKV